MHLRSRDSELAEFFRNVQGQIWRQSMSWTPLLRGKRKSAAIKAIDDILGAVDRVSLSRVPAPIIAHLALLNAYAAVVYDNVVRRRRALEMLDMAKSAAGDLAPNMSLFEGVITIAYVDEHVRALFRTHEYEDPNADIDEAFIDLLETEGLALPFDLMAGLAGLGMYALERKHTVSGIRLRDCVIGRLGDMSHPMDRGRAWRTRPPRTGAPDLVTASTGVYPTGMAHGAAGPVAFLAEALRGRSVRSGRTLMNDALVWIASQRNEAAKFPVFNTAFDPAGGPPVIRARYSWCWGDLGVWPALLGARDYVADPDVQSFTTKACISFTQQLGVFGEPFDACLCHGACGIAHTLNRIYQVMGWRRCGVAARDWFEIALAMRSRTGLAGFSFFGDRINDQNIFGNNVSIIGGIAGVGLALIAAVSDCEPRWDRFLGLGALS